VKWAEGLGAVNVGLPALTDVILQYLLLVLLVWTGEAAFVSDG